MPTILKGNYKNLCFSYIESAVQKYKLKGFVVSNIGDIRFLNNLFENVDNDFGKFPIRMVIDPIPSIGKKSHHNHHQQHKHLLDHHENVHSYLPLISYHFLFNNFPGKSVQ